MNNYPKVLIISHNVLCHTSNMGKTLLSFFDGWPADRLCQLYFHSEIPTTDSCTQYYRVTDFDLIHALPFGKPGTAFGAEDIEPGRSDSRTDAGLEANIYQAGRQRRPWMIFGRNALWSLNSWKTPGLDKWIRDCAADVILFASGDYVFAYGVVEYISRKYSLPVITAVFDDFYFFRGSYRSPLARVNTHIFKKTIKRLLKRSAGAIYIHPAMKERYDREFGTEGELVYSTAAIQAAAEPDNEAPVISYFGGIGLKRNEALAEIGRALLKARPHASCLIDVYSTEKDPELLAWIREENGLRFMGAVSPEEIARKERESDLLILCESSAPELRERLRFSLSTKTAEYLACGRCILAYGPEEAGVISYLKSQGVACVVTEPEALEDKLRQLLSSREQRRAYAAAQTELAAANHSPEKNREIMLRLIRKAAKAQPEEETK